MTEPLDRCCWPRCKAEYVMTYLGRTLCDEHWERVCVLGEAGNVNELVRRLGLPRERVEATITRGN